MIWPALLFSLTLGQQAPPREAELDLREPEASVIEHQADIPTVLIACTGTACGLFLAAPVWLAGVGLLGSGIWATYSLDNFDAAPLVLSGYALLPVPALVAGIGSVATVAFGYALSSAVQRRRPALRDLVALLGLVSVGIIAAIIGAAAATASVVTFIFAMNVLPRSFYEALGATPSSRLDSPFYVVVALMLSLMLAGTAVANLAPVLLPPSTYAMLQLLPRFFRSQPEPDDSPSPNT